MRTSTVINRHSYHFDYIVGLSFVLLTGMCTATATNITTIANNTLPLPQTGPGCEIVLAHDCSPQSLYAVYGSPLTTAGMKTVKMIIPHFKVEIARNIINGNVIIKINDVVEPVPVNEPMIITRSIEGQ
jgi:hypothetical protein